MLILLLKSLQLGQNHWLKVSDGISKVAEDVKFSDSLLLLFSFGLFVKCKSLVSTVA